MNLEIRYSGRPLLSLLFRAIGFTLLTELRHRTGSDAEASSEVVLSLSASTTCSLKPQRRRRPQRLKYLWQSSDWAAQALEDSVARVAFCISLNLPPGQSENNYLASN